MGNSAFTWLVIYVYEQKKMGGVCIKLSLPEFFPSLKEAEEFQEKVYSDSRLIVYDCSIVPIFYD